MTDEKLSWDVFDRIITEAKTLWGVRFFVISGGEPMAYRSEGKDLLDMAEKHNDCLFMMYTKWYPGQRKSNRTPGPDW